MKTLVVYYSRSGNTRVAAELISSDIDCDVEELIDTTGRRGPLGYLRAGRDAMNRKLTVIEDVKYNPDEYDLVVIGTPIWGGNMTPAVRTYITENNTKFKKVAFFITAGGTKFEGVFEDMGELSNLVPVATLGIGNPDVKSGIYKSKIEEFIEKIKD